MCVKIGTVTLHGKLMLAPMAGVTDRAFREVCRANGAALTTTEMVSTRALCYQDKRTPGLLELGEAEHPAAVQIFGHEPSSMAQGAQIARDLSGCDIIDINMGCPAPKIAGNGDGAALLRDPELAARVVEAVVRAVDVPVTVKLRLGWDEQDKNCVEVAQRVEQAGAAAIAVHGRTRAQQYSGTADWDMIAKVKRAVRIPVAANGDVFTPEAARDILAHTGADLVLIARGALGDPWIFSRTNALLETGVCPPLPPFHVRMDTAVEQIARAATYKGERVALLEARRHVNCYLKGESGLKRFKARVCALETLDELYALAEQIKQAAQQQPTPED